MGSKLAARLGTFAIVTGLESFVRQALGEIESPGSAVIKTSSGQLGRRTDEALFGGGCVCIVERYGVDIEGACMVFHPGCSKGLPLVGCRWRGQSSARFAEGMFVASWWCQ